MTAAAEIAERLRQLSPAQRAALNAQLATARASEAKLSPIGKVLPTAGGTAPLTAAQRRLWFLDRLSPGDYAYNSPLPLRLTGPLDTERLEIALRALVARHAVLRTSFGERDGEPFQLISPSVDVRLAHSDLSQLGPEEREERLNLAVVRHAQHRFDLTRAPLIAAELVKLGERDHALLLNLHHIVTDGWSVGVLLRDLDTLYRGERLPPLAIDYADLAYHEAGDDERLAGALEWWRQTLAGLPVTELPTDWPRPPQQSHTGDAVAVTIPPQHGRLVDALARQHGTSAFAVFLAAFAALLHRYTGEQDLAIGSVTANRQRPELEPLIGFFVNTLVMRQRLDPERSFAELVKQTHRTAMAALDHALTPFDRLVESVNPPRDPSRNPLVQVALSVQPDFPATGRLGDSMVTILSADYKATRFDLELHLFPDGAGGWRGVLTYAASLFSRESMEAFAARFRALLTSAVTRPATAVADLALTTPAEREALSAQSMGVPASPYVSLPERFAHHAAARPDHPAVICRGEQIGYRELGSRVETLAAALAERTPEGTVVAVLGPSSPALIIALLAIWRSGRCYLPLAHDLPPARIAELIADARPALLLTTASAAQPLAVDVPQASVAELLANATPRSLPLPGTNQLAYLIYTSGSTGRPKGVMVEHGGLSNLADAQADDIIPNGIQARVLQFAAISFDAFIFEVVMALAHGATLLLPDRGDTVDRLSVSARIRDGGATHVTLPPTLLSHLRPADHPSLAAVVVAGETCPAGLGAWANAVQLFNAYGPTETTVWSTIARVESDAAPTIGRPIRGHRVAVVDAKGAALPSGIAGEIAIGGVGLARGYLGDAQATAARFRTDLRLAPGERFYLTGDRGRLQLDGQIAFLGRTDQQLKLRGYRIEPAEIEAALARHPDVTEAAVTMRDGCLVAFAAPRESAKLDGAELAEFLRQRLPGYMVPDRIVAVPAMPRTRHGKLDLSTLVALPGAGSAPRRAAPAGEVEMQVAGIVAGVLGRDAAQAAELDRDADFFTLGGHSLLLLTLRDRLQRVTGRELALATLFAGSSIAQIARTLAWDDDAPGLPDHMLPFRREGNAAPLFLVHPAIGTSLGYGALADALPRDWPVFGLEAPKAEQAHDLTRLAASYVALVRQVAPRGPYRIGGWSLGGAIAFEMARQLEAAGEPVQLVLIDAGLPWRGATRGPVRIGALVVGLGRELLRSVPRSPADITDLARLAGDRNTGTARVVIGLARELMRRWPCFAALSRAWLDYAPGAYGGPTLIVRASTDGAIAAGDPLVETICPHLTRAPEIRVVRAAHLTLLGRKSVAALADAIMNGLATRDGVQP
ncbi:non-ribosomal peptide synthetase [Bradyrhizobium aeschynomenes]|uniref:non-ribosomal peptide synthetase n=1 Tax=Bradyrhizobium aeschynomenes TaxID=2734909 RepID=UPI001552EBF8|nr:non-ribosomal peptide synthetase [Bradyrhizobium aeschynomenes]NPV22750.1 amino acid adenylation domain-containing protein [Bradyrhizobium aeschynomenes]